MTLVPGECETLQLVKLLTPSDTRLHGLTSDNCLCLCVCIIQYGTRTRPRQLYSSLMPILYSLTGISRYLFINYSGVTLSVFVILYALTRYSTYGRHGNTAMVHRGLSID
jgi:hypothetical protein